MYRIKRYNTGNTKDTKGAWRLLCGIWLAAALVGLFSRTASAVNCASSYNVHQQALGGASTSIQAGITAAGATLSSDTCIVILDTGPYTGAVTVEGIDTAGYRLTIMASTAFTSSSPVVSPPAASTAAFHIMNDSVTVHGLNIVVDNIVPYGILSSSAGATISSVNVYGGGNISVAGILISSYSLVEYSSIAVQAAAHGLQIYGSDNKVTNSYMRGGAAGAAILLGGNNSGVIALSSNTILGGQYGLNVAALAAGANLSITSITFQSLTAGATAINFQGGILVATFTGVGFNSTDININVNADPLDTGSRLTIHSAAGLKAGPYFNNDLPDYIEWDNLSDLRFVAISSDTAVISWTLGVPVAPLMIISTNPAFTGAVAQPGTLNQGTTIYYGLISNATYYFKAASESIYSAPVSSATDPQAPFSYSVNIVSETQLNATWVAENNAPSTRYRAEAADDEGYTDPVSTITQETTFAFTGLDADTTYFMQVQALGVAGRDSDLLNMSFGVTHAYPPASETYALVASTGLSVFWDPSGNPAWTRYELNYSSASNFIPQQTAVVRGTSYEVTGLLPDTTYYFEGRAINGAEIGSDYYTFSSTVTAAALPALPIGTALTPGVSQVVAAWDQNGNPEDTEYYIHASTSGDFSGASYGPGTWAPAPGRVVTMLDSGQVYYFRVRARNRLGLATEYFYLGQAEISSGPDITPPTVLDNQTGDAAWRGGGYYDSGNYKVHFNDFGSQLDLFQVRLSTNTGFGAGTANIDWTDVETDIDAETYTLDWKLPPDIFDAIAQDVTTYVSVRVYDRASPANVAVSTDVFYVRRDTTTPTIDDYASSPAGWLSADPGLFNVDFADALSGLSRVRYSASSQAGTANGNVLIWTDIDSFTSSAAYTADWGVDFAALTNGVSNYISVQAVDNAGNTYEVKDVFRILKNMFGPSVVISNPDTALISTITAFSGTATPMNELSPVASVKISLRDLTSPSSFYYNGASFASVAPVWLTAAGQTAWTFNASTVPFVLETQYELRALALDINALETQYYPDISFRIAQTPPTLALSTPVAGSTVAVFDAVEGTALDNGSGLGPVEIYVKRLFDNKWWNFTAGAWGETRISSTALAGAAWHFTPGSALRGALAHGQQYFVTARARDAASPYNLSDYAAPGATFTCVDMQPPEAITQLSASTGTSPGRINLVWTFPGDEGIGLPIPFGRYAVHYATYPEVTFSTQAAQVNDSTGPVNAGAAQRYTVAGLTPEATYYLSVWVADDAGLWSGASPVVHTVSGENLNNEISGTVKKPPDTGITGVIIEAYDNTGVLAASAATLDDTLGSFTLSGLADGLYRVQATYVEDGFETSVAKDQLPMGYADVDFTLSVYYDLAAILGTVPAAAPAGLKTAAAGGGQVQLWQNGRKVAATAVDAAGRFAVRNLIPGRYTLKVTDAGGVWQDFQVKLESGQTLEISPLGALLTKGTVYAYPNPAVTGVKFHATIGVSPVNVQISVFSLDGKLVKSVEQAAAGTVPFDYIYPWDFTGSQPASGVYFYTLRVKQDASGQVETTTRKFAVVR